MALWAELIMAGVLPIAFGIWQIRDVRREQRRRAELRRQQELREQPSPGSSPADHG